VPPHLLHRCRQVALCRTRGWKNCGNGNFMEVPQGVLSSCQPRLRPPRPPAAQTLRGTRVSTDEGSEPPARSSEGRRGAPPGHRRPVGMKQGFGPPRPFPLAAAVVSNANLLRLITAANAAAAFTKTRRVPDDFHAQQEPSGCACASSSPAVSTMATAAPGAGVRWDSGGLGGQAPTPACPLLAPAAAGESWGWTDARTRTDRHTQPL